MLKVISSEQKMIAAHVLGVSYVNDSNLSVSGMNTMPDGRFFVCIEENDSDDDEVISLDLDAVVTNFISVQEGK